MEIYKIMKIMIFYQKLELSRTSLWETTGVVTVLSFLPDDDGHTQSAAIANDGNNRALRCLFNAVGACLDSLEQTWSLEDATAQHEQHDVFFSISGGTASP